MSERSCNKCVFGKIILDGKCENCILKSNFVKAHEGITLVNPPVHDDRALVKVQEEPDIWEELLTDIGDCLECSHTGYHDKYLAYDLLQRAFDYFG